MIMFKLLLVILLALPVILAAGFLYLNARSYAVKQNREEKRKEEMRSSDYWDKYRPY